MGGSGVGIEGSEKKLPLSCAPARDKIFAQEWHSVDKIRFENERMPGNEQGMRQRLPYRTMAAKAVAKQSETQTDRAR